MLAAILTGAMSLLNYYLWSSGNLTDKMQFASLFIQLILLIVTSAAAILYNGRRRKKLYSMAPYKIFTLPFGIILISLIGNLCVFAVMLLNIPGVGDFEL